MEAIAFQNNEKVESIHLMGWEWIREARVKGNKKERKDKSCYVD